MKTKVGVVSLGCPKNLVDSEVMLGLIKKGNYEITNNQNEAEVIIVNTCGFIESAKQESINTIIEMAQCKNNLCKKLIVTGCLAQRYKEELKKNIPEIDVVVGVDNYGDIDDIIQGSINGLNAPLKENARYSIDYLENDRVLTTGAGYAYIKIAEGCNNCCTYCVIPSIRGPLRSRKVEDIVSEAIQISNRGVSEIILVAQDSTRYGQDLYGFSKLDYLLKELSKISKVKWIRILYCYPEEIDDTIIDSIANNKKVVKYIDIPIQHISDSILKAMGRRGNSICIKEVITKLRKKIPEIVIRTSIITGFPGETEEDFAQLREFIEETKFDRLGTFAYSKEEGTPASKLKNQINKRIREKRAKEIMSLQHNISNSKSLERLNKEYLTLVEGVA